MSEHLPPPAFLHLHKNPTVLRRRYSASYVMVTAGIAGAFLCAMFTLSDVAQSRAFARLSAPCTWLGMNAITVFLGDEVLERAIPWVYWKEKDAHLLSWIEGRFQAALGRGMAANLALALADVAFWVAVAGIMHRRRWYVKV